MGIKIIILVIVLGLCSFNNFVKSTRYHISPTSEQTKYNHPIKSLQYFGDTYDCVEFLKQPAFNNPLLKKYANKYQRMMSSSFPSESESETYESLGVIGLPDGGCPKGTVPIRRITRENLTNNERKIIVTPTKAIVQTIKNEYHGAKMTIGIYNPEVSPTQYSGAQMLVGNNIEYMEVGWMVSPLRYAHDKESRLYIYTHSKNASCYDALCGQFVHTNPRVPLGVIFKPSIIGKEYYDQDFYIFRDQASGAWRFILGKSNAEIGFWPREIFTDLADFASHAEWGGIVKTTPDESGPPMGTGLLPNYVNEGHAFIDISVVNSTTNQLQVNFPTNHIYDGEGINIYDARDFKTKDTFKHLVEYGGPGPVA